MKKKKKSLVGWTYKDWTMFYAPENSKFIEPANTVFIPFHIFKYHTDTHTEKKVRITIEEL